MLQQEILETLRGLHRPLSPTDDLVLSLSVEEWMRLRGQVHCLARAEATDLGSPGHVKAATVALQGLNPNELFALVEQSGFLPEIADAPKTSALGEFLVSELRNAPGPMVEKLWRAVWAGDHKLSLFQKLDWPLAGRQIERILDDLALTLEKMPPEDNGDTLRALAKLIGHVGSLKGQTDVLAPGLVRAIAAGALHRFPMFERALRQLSSNHSLALAVLYQLGEHYLRTQRPFAQQRLSMTALALLLRQLDPAGASWLQQAKHSNLSDTLRGGLLWIGGIYSGKESSEVQACVDLIVRDIAPSKTIQPSLIEALAGLVDVTVRFSEAEGESLETRLRSLRRLSEGTPQSVLGRELLLAGPHLLGRVSARAWEEQGSILMRAAAADDLTASIALLNWPQPLDRELLNRIWQTVERNHKTTDLLTRLWETKFGIQRIGEELHLARGPLSAGLKACFSACTPVDATMEQACQLMAELLDHSLHLSVSATQSLLDTTLIRIPLGRLEMTSSLRELVEEFLAEEPGPYSDHAPHRLLSSFYYRQWAPGRS